VIVPTADSEGWPDASPRGDAPGFVRVVDEQRLQLPDRPGNTRLDGLQNLVANPRIGLLFLVPRRLETLRVNGTARLRADPELLAHYAVGGKAARTVLEITAKSVYFQCGNAPVCGSRSIGPRCRGLQPLPRRAVTIKGVSTPAVEVALEKAYRDRLY
jgi:predicted pyridoxine 5'-phosphate oxidase superfamily flavin-nucleotide-binding protein